MNKHDDTSTNQHKKHKANKELETPDNDYISFRLLSLILVGLFILMLIPTCIQSQQSEVTYEQR